MRVNFIIVAFDSSTEKFVVSLVCQKLKKKSSAILVSVK